MDFAPTLRSARKHAGYTSQESAAHALGVTLVTWARWERGETTPALPMLARIAYLLHTTPSKLLEPPGK